MIGIEGTHSIQMYCKRMNREDQKLSSISDELEPPTTTTWDEKVPKMRFHNLSLSFFLLSSIRLKIGRFRLDRRNLGPFLSLCGI